MPPDRKMTGSGRFINPGITSSVQYDHITIVLAIPVNMGHVEAAGVALKILLKQRNRIPV